MHNTFRMTIINTLQYLHHVKFYFLVRQWKLNFFESLLSDVFEDQRILLIRTLAVINHLYDIWWIFDNFKNLYFPWVFLLPYWFKNLNDNSLVILCVDTKEDKRILTLTDLLNDFVVVWFIPLGLVVFIIV